MIRLSRLTIALACVLASSTYAVAVPVQIDFNVAGFGPTDEAHQTFVKNVSSIIPPGLSGLPTTITFESLNELLAAQGHLHWDANDGNGYADGFGVRDFPNLHTGNTTPPLGSTYSQDEIEGNERLRLTFDIPVLINSFNLTDFFYENEGNLTGLPPCAVLDPNCYREIGEYSLNGGTTWIPFLADPNQLRGVGNPTNGVLTIVVNDIASSILLRAPGVRVVNGFPYAQLHDFSLAGINIEGADIPPSVPEPATITLLGLGLAGLGAKRFRRKR